MANYKLIQRNVNALAKDGEKKFYAVPVTERALSVPQFAKLATTDSALSSGEMLAALELFGKTALPQLLQGHSVEVPGIGHFRLSFSSKGVENPDDFNARMMISNPRVIFRPCAELKNAIKEGMYYENAGVRANGIDYASLAAYRKAKAEGSTGDNPSGGTGGTKPNPGDGELGE